MQRKGSRFLLLALLSLIVPVLISAAADRQTDVLQTSQGPLRITPIYHGSVMLEFGGKVILIDPSRGDFTGVPQPDLLLITHTHGDHLDREMITKLKKPSTVIVGSPAVLDTVNARETVLTVVGSGEKKTVQGIEIEGVPAYNIVRGDEVPRHHKGIGNGFILGFGDARVYLSGDTDSVPEIKSLKNITVAFLLGINSPAVTAQCVKDFRPKIYYPYHYNRLNTQEIADALKDTPEIEVRLRKLEGDP